jgi:RNA polymerase sigma-70 factor (ECF subfamily)
MAAISPLGPVPSTSPLAAAFLGALRRKSDGGSFAPAELETALQSLWEAGRAAWPAVDLPPEDLAREAGARAEAADGAAALERLHGADLYLACACARGIPGAAAAFEARFLSRVPAFVARADPAGELADEVAQELREKLLFASEGRPPRIADYSGRGALEGWLRIVALRAAFKLRRSQQRFNARGPAAPSELSTEPDPERDYLKLRYRGEYEEAFRSAVAALDVGERVFLKLHYTDGLNIERIGAMYQLHRATVARRLAAHRRKLLDLTRARLRERLRLSDSEFESILQLVRSQMSVSLRSTVR